MEVSGKGDVAEVYAYLSEVQQSLDRPRYLV